VPDGFVVTAMLAASDADPWTAPTVQHLEGQGIRVRRLPSPGEARDGLLRRMEELAASLDSSWFLVVEAGELRDAPWDVPLADAIREVDRLGYDAIDFEPLEFGVDRAPVAGDDILASFPFFRRPGARAGGEVRCWKKRPVRVDLVAGDGAATCEGARVFPLRFLVRRYVPGDEGRLVFDASAERLRLCLQNRDAETLVGQRQSLREALQATQASLEVLTRSHSEAMRLLADERVAREGERMAAAHQAERLQTCLAGQVGRSNELAEGLAGADRDRVAAESALARMGAEHERLRADHERLRTEHERLGAELAASRAEKEKLVRSLAEAGSRSREAEARRADAATQHEAILRSRIWRWTAPLRAILDRRGPP
jgi:hypothetical protein